MMNSYRNKLLAAAMLLGATAATAQNLNSAYYTDDYKFRHDLNPAFGNDQNYFSVPILGNMSASLHGNVGYGDVVFSNPLYGTRANQKPMTTFMNPYVSVDRALDGFSTGNNRVLGDVGITLLSMGFKGFGGYNTIELNSKTSFGMAVPYEMIEFARNMGNKSYDIGDVNFSAQSYVELAFGHSRQVNEKLRLGAKAKLLFGLARADVKLKDVKADLASNDKWTVTGSAEANVSMKGFEYETTVEDYDHREGSYEKIDDANVDGFGLSGFGLAIDLGGEYKIDDDWTVNAAIRDLGFIGWSNNNRAVNATHSFEFDGFRDIDATSGDGKETIDDKVDGYADQLADFANLRKDGDGGSRTTGIGATLNLGATYNLPSYRALTFGFLSSTRINGAYSWTEGRLSANYTPLSWLDGSVTLAANSFCTSLGWVVNFHPKGCNIFVGMDHFMGSLSKEGIPLSSNASLSLGMSFAW